MATWIEGSAFVPEITDGKLCWLVSSIIPVVREDNKLYKIEIPDLRETAYTWEPKITKEYLDLQEITRIKTHHYCSYYGFFKPSIAEVLSQIPEKLIEEIDAFEIIQDTNSGNDTEIKIFKKGNGHLATTILYKKS